MVFANARDKHNTKLINCQDKFIENNNYFLVLKIPARTAWPKEIPPSLIGA